MIWSLNSLILDLNLGCGERLERERDEAKASNEGLEHFK